MVAQGRERNILHIEEQASEKSTDISTAITGNAEYMLRNTFGSNR